MSADAALEAQLAEETRAKQRRHILSSTRARWIFVSVGAALLAATRLAGAAPISWWFISGFTVVCAAMNYAMYRVARDTPFRPWYAQLNFAISSATIAAVLYGVGPTGHVLYAVYLIAPLQAALYLGGTEAWQGLAINLIGFGLVTAIRTGGAGDWTWSLFFQESLMLTLACVALVPMLTRIVSRLRATRATLAQVEGGDLTMKVQDPEPDDVGYLGLTVNRTTEAIAEIVRQIQQQAQELAAMAQELAASAQQLQAASEEISAAAQQLTRGTERQRQLIGHGREDSEAAAGIASQLHGRAQDAERQINAVAQQARRHGAEIARANEVRARVRQTQAQITEVVAAMEEGRRTAQGVGAVSAAVRQALDAIFADLNATVTFATAFAGETEGQMRRMREMVQRMEEVAGIADSAAHGAEQTSAATEQQIASLGQLTTTSQHLSVAAAKLTETIQRFHVNGAKLPPPK